MIAVFKRKLPRGRLDAVKIVAHDAVNAGILPIVVGRKILKGLGLHQLGKPGGFHPRFDQTAAHTGAHSDAHVARILAGLAIVLRLTVIRGESVFAQKLPTVGFDLLVFTLQCRDLRRGVAAVQRRLHDPQTKPIQPTVQLPQLGNGGVKLLTPHVRFRLRAEYAYNLPCCIP